MTSKGNFRITADLLSTIGKGTGISVMTSFLTGAGMALLIITGKLKDTMLGYTALAALIISTITGAASAVRRGEQAKLLIAIGTGIGYYLCLMALNIIFFQGIYDGLAVTLLTVLGSSLAAFILAGKPKRKQNRRKGKVRHG